MEQGATFRARLPLVRPHADDESRPARRRRGATPPLASLGGVRVLVVDDEHDTLEMFDGILAVAGAEVRRATGATPAIEMLERVAPGRDRLRHRDARTRTATPSSAACASAAARAGRSVPAVAVTAYGGVVDRIRVLSAGFQMHVPKPVEPAELVAAVAALAQAARRDPAGP